MMLKLSTGDLITIAGWLATFVLGVALTLIGQRIARVRKKIAWSLINESNILSREVLSGITAEFRVPITILVDSIEQSDLSTIRVKLANAGNIEIENIKVLFRFGESTTVHVGRFIGELGAYRQAVSADRDGDSASISIKHINPRQSIEIEFLVGNYQIGDLEVDLAAPGVSLQRTDPVNLERSLNIVRYLSLGALGVKYDPVANQTALLVEEVTRLRKVLEHRLSN